MSTVSTLGVDKTYVRHLHIVKPNDPGKPACVSGLGHMLFLRDRGREGHAAEMLCGGCLLGFIGMVGWRSR